MKNLVKEKKWILIAIPLLIILLCTALVLWKNGKTESLFTLSEREVLLQVGDSKTLELELNNAKKVSSNMNVSWKSSKSAVATVDENGTVEALAGGEARVTAVVEYKGKQYSTQCVVTVKEDGDEYSTYKIRWFTQKPDRRGYDIQEETFERLIGSDVELTELDALKRLPENYALNKEKSIFSGKVKKAPGGCILEVYFDVAEITYFVDYYYESDTKLGTYPTVETRKYKAYAFTPVEVSENPKTGFVINNANRGTVKSSDSVTAGARLKVFCDRIRSKVTVTYLSGKPSATYDCIYGIGLINAPADVFKDSIEYKITTYVNGKKKEATADLMKEVTGDTVVAFKLDGRGFEYTRVNGKGVITNTSTAKQTPSFAVLKGADNTVYLSATYKTTGSFSNTFGINLSDGNTTRQIRFSGTGVSVMKKNTTTGGVGSANDAVKTYAQAGIYNDNEVFVWARNAKGSNSTSIKASSVISDMMRNTEGGSYDIRWAVLDNVLYASINGETVLQLPLKYLEKTWNGNNKYQIGISSYDENAYGDALQVSNVNLKFGKEAKALLVTEKSFDSSLDYRMGYDVFTGAYLPSSNAQASYMYGQETNKDTGIAANIEYFDIDNARSAVGVSLKVGDESIQYVVEGENSIYRSMANHTWEGIGEIQAQIMKEGLPISADGKAQVSAFVKGDYFHIMYNGVQVQCINMLSLFPEYTRDTKVSVGICTWDARYGLMKFTDVKQLSESEVNGIANADEWGFYSQSLNIDDYDFHEASIVKTKTGWKRVKLHGSNTTWQIDGTMNRLDDTTLNLLMGFQISDGDNKTLILGYNNGFKNVTNDNWNSNPANNHSNNTDYKSTRYAFNNIVTTQFFNSGGSERTQKSLDYRAVLYNDTLYVWFKDEAGNEGLCWRIPLTEKEFGGYKAGTAYEITLVFAETDTDASMTNLDVKMGYQVTEQTQFVADNKGTPYDFCEAIEKIDANISRWQKSFRAKAISGMMAEELCSTSTVIKSQAHAYLVGSDDDIYLSATHEIAEGTTAKFFGISLMSNDGEERSILYNGKGVRIFQERNWKYEDVPALKDKESDYYTKAINGYVWTQNGTSTLDSMLGNLSNTHEHVTKWAITDGVVYGMVDDFVFFRMPLNEICADWDEDTKLQIGFAHWDMKNNGSVKTIKDIEVSFGDDALAKMVKDKEIEYASNWGMVYEVFTGHYMPWAVSGGAKYIYGEQTTDTQMMKATISFVDKNVGSSAGITVKSSSGESAQIVVQANNNKVRLMFGQGWNNNDISAWCHAKPFDAEGLCQVTAIVKNDTLYIYYNDKLAGAIDLYKILDGYKADGENEDKVQLGIYSWDGNKGLSLFTDIAFKAGKDAEEYITSNHIVLDDSKEWEIFTTEANGTAKGTAIVNDGTGNVAGTNMTANGGTHICTPTANQSNCSVIYGIATSMPQKLTAKITLADASSSGNGVSIECGGESVQFYIPGKEQYIRTLEDHTWKNRRDKGFTGVAYNQDGVYEITAIVKDGMFYLVYNEAVAFKAELAALFPGYSGNEKVRLGVCTWDSILGVSQFSDVVLAAGASVNVNSNIAYNTIAYAYPGSLTRFAMDKYGSFGKASADEPDGYMVFDGKSKVWEVTGTIKRSDAVYGKYLRLGFNIEQDKWMYIMGAGSGISLRYNDCGNSWNAGFDTASNRFVLKKPANTDLFSNAWSATSDKDVEFKAVIYEDVFYAWIDGEPVWRLELTKKIAKDEASNKVAFAGMTPDKAYKFGLVIDRFSEGQIAQFNNVNVKMSDPNGSIKAAVDAFEAVYKAAHP